MKNHFWIFSFFFAFSFLLLVLISPDSYFHGIEGHSDSGVFFMYGKAMMKGMVPYIDFNEAKGPLLFLIYGIGYLLDNSSYLGVFWISCLFYALIFYFTYKTSEIFVDSKTSLAVSLLMSIAYFNPLLHYEIRCEDFSQLFIISSLYAICRMLYLDDSKNIGIIAIVQGLGMGATMLLKFNISAMLVVFVIYGITYSIKKHMMLKYLSYGIIGLLLFLLPFLCYFVLMKAWPKCLYEFLSVVEFTVKGTGGDPNLPYISRIINNLISPVHLIVFITTFMGTLLYAQFLKEYRWFPLLSFLFFFFVTIQNGAWHYYYSTCSVFYIFLILSVFRYGFLKKHMLLYSLLLAILLVIPTNLFRIYSYKCLFFQASEERLAYYKYSYVMSQVKDPKYIKMSGFTNLDVLCGALPGFKYMGVIPGEPNEVTYQRIKTIRNKSVDFVQVNRNSSFCDSLSTWGYQCYDFGSPIVIYSPRQLSSPPKDYYVSSSEVLKKKSFP